ncbi:hypothetical protein [Plantactinospora sp. GCM10030261]|uniref:hypothetical protein n=1 Tax=Plantactinospora sp. GCM10030261 TaxID=3273420 RepID=UPI00360A1157
MRRGLVALTLSGVLAGLAGCGSDGGSTDAGPSSAAPTSASPSPAAADYTADTQKVCAELDTSLNAGVKAFGTGLGEMIAHREAGKTAEANKAKQAAQKRANDLATQVRTSTGAALDPDFQAAGAKAADAIAASAEDEAFFAGLKTEKDITALESEVSNWVVPVAAYCG